MITEIKDVLAQILSENHFSRCPAAWEGILGDNLSPGDIRFFSKPGYHPSTEEAAVIRRLDDLAWSLDFFRLGQLEMAKEYLERASRGLLRPSFQKAG